MGRSFKRRRLSKKTGTIVLVVCAVAMLTLFAFSIGHGAPEKVTVSEMEAPWNKVEEYAVTKGELKGPCYIYIVQKESSLIKFAFVYCVSDGSAAIQRAEGGNTAMVARIISKKDGSIVYAIADKESNTTMVLTKDQADVLVYKLIREMVSQEIL